MGDEDRERITRKVDQVQQRYEGHGKVFRVVWVVAAITVILAGLAMTVFPGPAVVVIPVGLAMLAMEFAWARRLLSVSIERGVDAKERMQHVSAKTKVLQSVALACLVAAVVALVALIVLR
jgi:Putative transmembrane protein (PGPGW)